MASNPDIFDVGNYTPRELISPEEGSRLAHHMQWLTGDRNDPPEDATADEIVKRDRELAEHREQMRKIAECAIWLRPLNK